MTSSRWQNKNIIRRIVPAVLAGLLLVGCADLTDDTQLAEERVRDALPTQEFFNVEMIHTDKGEKTFLLRAPYLDQYGNQNRAELYGGIQIDFFKEGRVSSHLTSDSGVVLRNGDELRGIGNVVVTTDTGTTILTPRMKWTRLDGLITSDTIVTIITEYDTLHGTGLVATDDLKKRRILHPTGVTMRSVKREEEGEEQAPPPAPVGQAAKVDTTLYLQAADSTGAAMDTILAEPDSTTLDPDTTVAKPDTTDSTAAGL
ncbi:LPS export ABC transporter periplasmic protein LptC [bacterium]|nr:LPS export ABC transporter periplasmic protein LptC [bacterium]